MEKNQPMTCRSKVILTEQQLDMIQESLRKINRLCGQDKKIVNITNRISRTLKVGLRRCGRTFLAN
jgi:hypothetical protein